MKNSKLSQLNVVSKGIKNSRLKLTMLGNTYGELTCTTEFTGRKGKNLMAGFTCSCGNVIIAARSNVKSGHTKSCGCIWLPAIIKRLTTKENGSAHPLWSTYKGMVGRCINKGDSAYPYYGGRGIKVCDRWAENFWNFVSDMGDRPQGYTLDRINVNGDYEPSNCRWASRRDQSGNTRITRFVLYNGAYISLSEATRRLKATTITYEEFNSWRSNNG